MTCIITYRIIYHCIYIVKGEGSSAWILFRICRLQHTFRGLRPWHSTLAATRLAAWNAKAKACRDWRRVLQLLQGVLGIPPLIAHHRTHTYIHTYEYTPFRESYTYMHNMHTCMHTLSGSQLRTASEDFPSPHSKATSSPTQPSQAPVGSNGKWPWVPLTISMRLGLHAHAFIFLFLLYPFHMIMI